MRKLISLPLVLALATLIHVDWHFARPVHHRLSLGWPTHWLFGIVFFAIAGWYFARRWPDRPWIATAWNVGIALVTAQVLEPVLEAAYYGGRFGYTVEPERWAAFWECIGAGLPAVVLVIWFCQRRATALAGAAQHGAAPVGAAEARLGRGDSGRRG